jgi:hypothetical protein
MGQQTWIPFSVAKQCPSQPIRVPGNDVKLIFLAGAIELRRHKK